MKKSVFIFTKFLAGMVAGYLFSHHLSHPNGKAIKHVPLVRMRRIQILPNLLIAAKDKRWHIHHWTYLPALYAPFIILMRPLLKRYWLHGLIVGSMIHGLTFQDRFTFRTK